jgi:FkbM family methyltransferase
LTRMADRTPAAIRRVGGRLRQGLGLEGLGARLDRVDQRLDQIERAIHAARWPNGPVYLGDHEALVQARWGAKIIVDTTDRSLAPWLLADGLWESHVTGWMHDFLQPGAVMVDVGANIGYFTLLAARRVGPTGRVVSIEAHPRLVEILRRNVALNGHLGTTTVHHMAAWSGPETVRIHMRKHFAANSSIGSIGDITHLADTEEVVDVEAKDLDSELGDLERIDLMKIDIEGSEVQALRGLAKTLDRNPEVTIMFEWSPAQIDMVGDDPAELLKLLEERGFTFRSMEDDLNPITTGELLRREYGNVVAKR